MNVVSVLGHMTAPLQAPYCTVKYGVEALSDCLRSEMRRWGVDVVVVEPGEYTTGAYHVSPVLGAGLDTSWPHSLVPDRC